MRRCFHAASPGFGTSPLPAQAAPAGRQLRGPRGCRSAPWLAERYPPAPSCCCQHQCVSVFIIRQCPDTRTRDRQQSIGTAALLRLCGSRRRRRQGASRKQPFLSEPPACVLYQDAIDGERACLRSRGPWPVLPSLHDLTGQEPSLSLLARHRTRCADSGFPAYDVLARPAVSRV